MSLKEYSREGYDPEWLALEDAMGGRYRFDANLEEKVPEFNNNFGALAKLWPDPAEPLKIYDEDVGDTKYQQRCRIYQPESSEPLPLMVFFHGGGFVAGNLDTDEPQCKIFAAKTPCVVVSIDYPLAPTYKFERIREACIEATLWAKKNASRWGANPNKILLCGGSAGATLVQTIGYYFGYIVKDTKMISGCVMLFAALGNWNYQGEFKEHHRAWDEMATTDQPFMNRQLFEDVAVYWELDFESPSHFPLLEADLSNFPPSYMAAGSKDILKDDPLVFDMRLRKAGVKSKFKLYEGMPHWFHSFPQLKMAHVMLADTVEGIRWLVDDNAGP